MSNSGFPPPDLPFQGMRPPFPPPPPPPHFRPDLGLPPNWEAVVVAATGEIYYHNRLTGETTWTRPTIGIIPPPPPPPFMPIVAPTTTTTTTTSTPAAAEPTLANAKTTEKSTKKPKKTKKPIPDTDWLLVRTSDGLEFYFEKSTKKSVWEIPEELKEPVKKLKEEEELERKRKLEEEEEADENETAAKRLKGAEEKEGGTTELTEEDLMWQLQQMDPEEIEAMGLNVGGEEEDGSKEPYEEPKGPESAAAAAAAAPAPSGQQPQISDEEKIELFTHMLLQKNIDPFSTWEKELPKFINDERYALLPHGKRKNLFNNFCRVKAEEIKANKPVSKSPEKEFISLLKEEATAKMYWEDFRRKAKNDRRFKLIKESKTREALFKDYVRWLRKQKDAAAAATAAAAAATTGSSSSRRREEEYKELLRTTKEIKPGLRWRDAKLILEKDERYHAIESKRMREDLFRDYLEELQVL